ncbi:MAG: HlyD family secretion protein [Chloroflexota bacterium]
MNVSRLSLGLMGLAMVGLLAACNGTAAAETLSPDQVPVVPRSTDSAVVAEAVLEPARWSELSFESAGQVTEVQVSVGQRVSAGTLLLRLDTAELQLSLESARQDVLAQQAALDELLAGESQEVIARAERENAQQIAQAGVALKIKQQGLEKSLAQDNTASIAIAQARIEQLQRQQDQSRAQDLAADVTVAQVEVARAQKAVEDAQAEYNKALDRTWEPQEVRDGYAHALQQAQWNLQQAQAQLQQAQAAQQAHLVGLQVLEAQIDEAQAQLVQELATQKAYSVTLDILTSEIELAQLDLDHLQAWENPYLDEPSEEAVSQARVRVRKAELAVSQLELQMAGMALRAPFDAVVVEVKAAVGDRVDPAQGVIVLATLDQLQARTVNLVELDVARLVEGQPALVSVDALPGLEFPGVVERIALQAGEYRGDVTYAVTVRLDGSEQQDTLRWGMTAVVRIDTGD